MNDVPTSKIDDRCTNTVHIFGRFLIQCTHTIFTSLITISLSFQEREKFASIYRIMSWTNSILLNVSDQLTLLR
jgi:hypothetical protein